MMNMDILELIYDQLDDENKTTYSYMNKDIWLYLMQHTKSYPTESIINEYDLKPITAFVENNFDNLPNNILHLRFEI